MQRRRYPQIRAAPRTVEKEGQTASEQPESRGWGRGWAGPWGLWVPPGGALATRGDVLCWPARRLGPGEAVLLAELTAQGRSPRQVPEPPASKAHAPSPSCRPAKALPAGASQTDRGPRHGPDQYWPRVLLDRGSQTGSSEPF